MYYFLFGGNSKFKRDEISIGIFIGALVVTIVEIFLAGFLCALTHSFGNEALENDRKKLGVSLYAVMGVIILCELGSSIYFLIALIDKFKI